MPDSCNTNFFNELIMISQLNISKIGHNTLGTLGKIYDYIHKFPAVNG